MLKYTPTIFYETPGGAAGAGTATTPGAPGDQGQGQPNGLRQTFFANVPDEVWAAMEPHLTEVNRYVTQSQQTNAALKDYTPQQVQGLVRFAEGLATNPMAMWERLTRDLQARNVIDSEVDLDHFMLLAQGQDPDASGGQMPDPNQQQGLPGDMPEWAQQLFGLVEQLGTTVQELHQARETDQRTSTERRQDAVLKATLTTMKDKLKAAGIPEELIDEKRLQAALLVHKGNSDAATQAEIGYRTETLKGFTTTRTDPSNQRQNLELEPDANGTKSSSRKAASGDEFASVRGEAEQFVAAQIARDAQGS